MERERHERSLKAALARQQVLVREITHRGKNSLAIVASMLKLQAAEVDDPVLICSDSPSQRGAQSGGRLIERATLGALTGR